MTTYQYNTHGVCINPTIFFQKDTKEYSAMLKVAQIPTGQWVYGYAIGIKFGNHTYTGGPAGINGRQYTTRQEAEKAATEHYIKRLPEMLQSAREYNKSQQPIESSAQTTLF